MPEVLASPVPSSPSLSLSPPLYLSLFPPPSQPYTFNPNAGTLRNTRPGVARLSRAEQR
jgi:hypothetical protein